MARLAMLSLHTSPLAQPGMGDGGGMNVYVHALASSLARAGVEVDVLTRADHAEQPPVVEVSPRFRVVHLEAGPRAPVSRGELVELVDPLVDAARDHLAAAPADVLHANYWLSGVVAHRLKHELNVPLMTTFHTLALVKADAGIADDPAVRVEAERDVARCADLVLASTAEERDELVARYDADPTRVDVLAPGVDRQVFSPGDVDAAQSELGLTGRRVVVFVGRIQPLKGLDVAVRALAELGDPSVVLVVVGGPSGPEGERELAAVRSTVTELDLDEQVRFVPPVPHDDLVRYYRAAEVCVVPSRTESFGLVALEAAACATPVVAADVGGLAAIVVDGETGLLVDGRAPSSVAAGLARLLDDPELAESMGERGASRAAGFTWGLAAARVRRQVADLGARAPVEGWWGEGQGVVDIAAAHELVDAHLTGSVAGEEWTQAVEFDPELRRWYVRFGCEGRDATTIYFDLHERTLRYEVYFLPDPPANHLDLYRYVLRRNHTLYGAKFSLGPDGDLYLVGRVALEHLTRGELDRIIGVIYETVETWFQPIVGIAFDRDVKQ